MSAFLKSLAREVSADLEKGARLSQEIDAAGERLAALKAKIKDRHTMKYALESLPELIGAHQFNILIDALGLTDEYLFVKSDGGRDAGEFFAAAVTQKANGNRRKMSENERALDRKLTGAPEGLDV